MSKQPLYTALGWTVWQIAKRYAKRRVASVLPGPKLLVAGAVVTGVAAAALTLSSSSSADA